MVILGLETVTRAGSLALARGDRVEGFIGDPARTHGERLPGEITDWMARLGQDLADVDRFAVVTGPGSFTGLRVGIAAVQGLALATGRQIAGVPTLDALATTWLDEPHAPGDLLVACLDGQRGEVFLAAWRTAGRTVIEACTPVIAPGVARPDALAGLFASAGVTGDVVLVGDGARRYREALDAALPGARLVEPRMSLAEAAVRIAARRPELSSSPHAVRPVYIRRPDVELVRERRATNGTAAATAFHLRRGNTRDDVTSVEALQRQTFSNPWGAEAIRWELENTDVARLYVMHDGDGNLVAYCACWMIFDELHINSLAVDLGRRRRGLARQLLTYVLGEAARSGARSATLEVRSSNHPARGLYEGMGFSVEGLRRDYYQDPREDAVILWKRDLC